MSATPTLKLPKHFPFRCHASKPAAQILLRALPTSSQPALLLATRHSPSLSGAEGPLATFFDALFAAHGPQHWWPGRTPFEIIVGAILVQNTAWTNAARAISNLREARLLTPAAIENVPLAKLARLVRPSGYFRQKARKLKAFVHFLRENYRGSLKAMFRTPTAHLREQLLQVHGIGPETADSILLYAGNHPVFVVDAYTRRILERHGLAHGKESYEGVRGLFEQSLPNDPMLFNEFHALMVHTGKHHCLSRAPICSTCALRPFLPHDVEASR